jgi:hypothetical protein
MLGSLIVPAARLDELEQYIPEDSRPWRVNALVGPNLRDELVMIERFTGHGAGRVEWIEAKVSSAEQIQGVRERVPRRIGIYFETSDPALLRAVRASGSRAKVRTGGLTPQAFPSPDALARFMTAAATQDIAFKATAGLHHPLRCDRPLTYKRDSPNGPMHGFLNVILAGVFARGGILVDELCELLEETSLSAFAFEQDAITWRYHRLSNQQIREGREKGVASFGSCSFTEPVEELRSFGLL